MDLNFLKKKKKFKKTELGNKPNIYWKYILLSTVILVLGAFVFGFILFSRVNNGADVSSVEIPAQEAVKADRLDKVLQYFAGREKRSIEILNSPSPIIDPSL